LDLQLSRNKATVVVVKEPTITKSKKNGAAGMEYNIEHAHWFSFYMKGIFHCEFVPLNTMVNSDFYCDVLRHLRENVHAKDLNFGATTTQLAPS
jgi:hypothetical protein